MNSFAIIPAAGISERMGHPKLLLPWRGEPLLTNLLRAWQAGGVSQRVVVLRPEATELQTICQQEGATVCLLPRPTPDMKATVQFGLDFVERHFSPGENAAWLLAPADQPQLSAKIVQHLLATWKLSSRGVTVAAPVILVPTLAGRRGHPVLFPWQLAAEVGQLEAQEGVKALLARFTCQELACDAIEPAGLASFADVDTPADFEQLPR